MTREQWKERLKIANAFDVGKPIECRKAGGDGEWRGFSRYNLCPDFFNERWEFREAAVL